VNGVTTNFLFDGSDCVKEASSSATIFPLYGPGSAAPLERAGLWFTPDHRGSTTTLTNSSGTTVQSYGYGPFGQVRPDPNPPTATNPFQFGGGMNDGNGLLNLQGSNWSPNLGRSIGGQVLGGLGECARDTIVGFVQLLNPFATSPAQIQEWAQRGIWEGLKEDIGRLFGEYTYWFANPADVQGSVRSLCKGILLVAPFVKGRGGSVGTPSAGSAPLAGRPGGTSAPQTLLRAIGDGEANAITAAGGAVASTNPLGGTLQNSTRVFLPEGWARMKPFFESENALRPGTYTQIVRFVLNGPVSMSQEASTFPTYAVNVNDLNSQLSSFSFTPFDQFQP
jgi:hypothetical protein